MAIHNRQIEYRIKPVTRYIVTRYESGDHSNGAEQIGNEYDTADVAYQVGYAVCAVEHQRLGWDIGDERIKYPSDPTGWSRDRITIADVREATYVPPQQIPGADVQAAKFDLRNLSHGQGLVAGPLARP
jgi:hypothetical protein